MGFHAQKLPSCIHALCLRRKQRQEEEERGRVLRTTVLSCGCGFINLAEKKDQVLLISAAFGVSICYVVVVRLRKKL